METGAPPINEAVALLASFAPEKLALLSKNAPDQLKPYLRPGGILGRDTDPLTKARAEIVSIALQEVIRLSDAAVVDVQKRLRTASTIRVIGEALAVIGSSSVLLSLARQSSTIAVVSGIVALGGSLAGTLSGLLLRPFNAKGKSLLDVYSDLVALNWEAKEVGQEIAVLLRLEESKTSFVQLAKFVGRANVVSRRINELNTLLMLVVNGNKS